MNTRLGALRRLSNLNEPGLEFQDAATRYMALLVEVADPATEMMARCSIVNMGPNHVTLEVRPQDFKLLNDAVIALQLELTSQEYLADQEAP